MRRAVRVMMVVAALLAAGCGGAEEPAAPAAEAPAASASPFENADLDVAYVGDAACATCHEDLYASYQEHGMAQSFYPLTAEVAVEDFAAAPVYNEANNLYYRSFTRDGRFFQEEYRVAGGRTVHRLVREMNYVVGSGSAARTYLTAEGGRLYELPLTWYPQAERWDFSPGYETSGRRFDRLIPDRCMGCHNAVPETVPFVEGKYTSVPHGIGCERCHGPGELHVEARLEDPEVDGPDYTIVNPAHLDLGARMDVCSQCHLQGDVSILREGRGPFDFRPSEPLAAHVAVYSEATPTEEGIDVISHADRLAQSACFEAGTMDCTTCHDPHEGFRDEGPAYFNNTCISCHETASLQAALPPPARPVHTAEANCIDCHMPKVQGNGTPHATFTDHWIRVVRDSTRAPAPAEDAQRLVAYFEQDRVAPSVYEGMAYVVYGRQRGLRSAMERGIRLLEDALRTDPGHGEAHYLLGYARMQLGQMAEARPALERAVELGPDIPERLNTLAQAYEAMGVDPSEAARLYRRALEIQPALAEVRVNYGRLLDAQGRLTEAAEAYAAAAEEQPWLAIAHYNLGTARLRQGRTAEAEAALREAVTLAPDYAEALGNLGLLLANAGRTDEALALFERAVTAAPDDPVMLGNLALAYLQSGDAARASQYARRALAIDPSNGMAQQVLGAAGG